MEIYIEKQPITVVLLFIWTLNLSVLLLSLLPILLSKKQVENVNDSIFRVAYWSLEATKPKWAISKLHELMTKNKWVAILIYTIVAVFIFYFVIVGWGRTFEMGYRFSGIENQILENRMNLVYHFMVIFIIFTTITYVEYVFDKIRLLYSMIVKIILTLLYAPSFICIAYSLINKIEGELIYKLYPASSMTRYKFVDEFANLAKSNDRFYILIISMLMYMTLTVYKNYFELALSTFIRFIAYLLHKTIVLLSFFATRFADYKEGALYAIVPVISGGVLFVVSLLIFRFKYN